jgi:hypothetical protein
MSGYFIGKTTMRLMTATMIAAMAVPTLAMAQMSPQPAPIARPGNVIGTDQSLPLSSNASNITSADTRSTIAPRLPNPDVGPGAGPKQLLMAARQALAANQTGAAQEALERAETRALDRSVAPSRAGEPDSGRFVRQIGDARRALATGDKATTMQMIDAALRS